MSKEIDQIVQTLSSLTIKDALTLVKQLEESWGVSAAATAVAAAPAAAAEAAPEDVEFEVLVKAVESSAKIPLVRHVKDALGLTLLDAKKFVDGLPQSFKSGLTKDEAEGLKQELEKIGAQVELKTA